MKKMLFRIIFYLKLICLQLLKTKKKKEKGDFYNMLFLNKFYIFMTKVRIATKRIMPKTWSKRVLF